MTEVITAVSKNAGKTWFHDHAFFLYAESLMWSVIDTSEGILRRYIILGERHWIEIHKT